MSERPDLPLFRWNPPPAEVVAAPVRLWRHQIRLEAMTTAMLSPLEQRRKIDRLCKRDWRLRLIAAGVEERAVDSLCAELRAALTAAVAREVLLFEDYEDGAGGAA